MPIQRCSKDGNNGWKYGDSGKCYTGPGAKEKAIKQMRAIKHSEQKSKGHDLIFKVQEQLLKSRKKDE